jgi:hypothetical protein
MTRATAGTAAQSCEQPFCAFSAGPFDWFRECGQQSLTVWALRQHCITPPELAADATGTTICKAKSRMVSPETIRRHKPKPDIPLILV